MAFRSSISTGKPEQLLSLMCVFFRFPIRSRAQFMRLVYARENDPNYNSIRFEKPNKEYLVMILAVKRKLWAIFLPWVHLEEKQTSGSRLKHKQAYAYLNRDFQRHFTLNTCLRERKLLSLYMFFELCLFHWLLVVPLAMFHKIIFLPLVVFHKIIFRGCP